MEKKLHCGDLFKRVLSLAMALVMLLSFAPVPHAHAADATYIVAGVEGLCGSNWDGTDVNNQMTLVDGLYTKTFANVPAGENYQFKVVKDATEWIGDATGNNVTFNVTATCDVTVTFDASTKEITVTGDDVEVPNSLKIDAMRVVGNGDGSWLNGVNWDPADDANLMTETSEGVYEITFKNVEEFENYQFKFAANGSWADNWGGTYAGSGVETDAVYNGSNIVVDVPYELADVTLKLDLTNFNYATKKGAKFTVTITEVEAEPAVEYCLFGYINGANYACEEDYANMGEYKFVDGKVKATFTETSYVAVKTTDNAKWYMTDGWQGEVTSATLYDTATLGDAANKLMVPGNTEVVFTLVENEDGTLTLSYAEEKEEPTVEYYLFGYINGANYACEEDYANMGEYKFVDGKVKATFTETSYVAVKTTDNAKWYMTDGWQGEVTSATLYDTSTGLTDANKLMVPGNTEVVFTLVENEDGTLTLSYAPAVEGTKVTIHFLKPDAWTGVNAWVWDINGAIPGYEQYQGTWPGAAISENAEHAGWYDVEIVTEEPQSFNFIFSNNGSPQTDDLSTGAVNGDTEIWVVGSTQDDVLFDAPQEWFSKIYTVNIHAQKPADWAEPINVYAWLADTTKLLGTWPGTAATKDTINDGWYDISVQREGDASGFNFIINDGAHQTGDLETGALTKTVTDLWVVNGAVQTEAPEGYIDANRIVSVPGTLGGNNWTPTKDIMTYDPDLGLYVYTFENVPPANYEFKIAINGSWDENYGVGGVRDGGNIAVAVPETMDVTVYYNDETHLAVTNVTYKFLDIALSGTGIPAGTKMTDKGLTGIYKATVTLPAGTYEDIKMSIVGGAENTFNAFELEKEKDVTFFYDPASGFYYCDAIPSEIDETKVYFDSQDVKYKAPFGSPATGEEVTFSIDTGAEVKQVSLVITGKENTTVELTTDAVALAEADGTSNITWTGKVTLNTMGEYDYYFVLSDGSTPVVYCDDDGFYGEGQVTDLSSVKPYDLVVHKAGFETPDWMKDAVIYQIFPDRFFDGDETNNQAQTWARGTVDYEYITDWYTLPENPEQLGNAGYPENAHAGDGEWSNEIYGGDLEGITQRIGYLKALGVNVIYLNPVFWSISNHRYDAVDYTEIDPILGTLGDFEELVRVAEANGMHIILDGVFNHVSDDSVYFDRYYKFLPDAAEKFDGKIGAYPYWAYVYDYMEEKGADQGEAETAAKAYFTAEYGITDYSYTEWFQVSSKTMTTADTIGLRAGKPVYSYEGWWGYDSMPIIYATNGSEYQTGNWAEEIINDPNGTDSVTEYWITKGNNGWRLDVANEVSDETWQQFRASVKALDSDAVIIGEIWDDATKYLMGDMYDSVMNYQFRNAVTGFAMGTNAETTTKTMEKIRERYPEEAFYAMMNLVGSHDTTRILSYLDGIGDDRADKSMAAAFPTYATTSQTAKDRQYLVSFLQFTYAGAPTIYYGDEIGMVGADDPDDRRAFEWGKGNKELVEWYAKLAAIREAYPSLRTGSVQPIDTENKNVMGYARDNIIILANNASSAQTVAIEGTYVDVLRGGEYTDSVDVPALNGVILVLKNEIKTIDLDKAGLAPAYDASYTVAKRHIHEWDEGEITTPATCVDEGVKTYRCKIEGCKCSYTEAVPATGEHNLVTVKDIAPTCVEYGYVLQECTGCDYAKTWSPDPTNVHVVENGKCIHCGYVPEQEFDCEHENAAIENSVAADCYYEGVEMWKCPDCGETWTETIPATGEHKFEDGQCTVCGLICEHEFEEGECTICGEADPDYVPEESVPSTPIKPAKPNWKNWLDKIFGNWWGNKDETPEEPSEPETEPTEPETEPTEPEETEPEETEPEETVPSKPITPAKPNWSSIINKIFGWWKK